MKFICCSCGKISTKDCDTVILTFSGQLLDEYQKSFGDSWKTVQTDNAQQWPYLSEALTKFQVFWVHSVCLIY